MTDWEKDILKELKKREYFWSDQDFIIDLIKSEIKKAVEEVKRNEEMKYANWEWNDVLKDRGIE